MRREALEAVYRLANKDEKIVFVGSDLGTNVAPNFKESFPDRYFMEGISEQHLIGFCAGLAIEGYRPFFNTIANFITRRALEQIIVDLCIQNLPVILLGNGGGAVYAQLGPTHTAIDDLAILYGVPNLNIYCPADKIEMNDAINMAYRSARPAYIRFGKGGEPNISNKTTYEKDGLKIFGPIDKSKVIIVTTGITAHIALDVMEKGEKNNINISVAHFFSLAPELFKELRKFLKKGISIVVVEEHLYYGGLHARLLQLTPEISIQASKIISYNLGDEYLYGYGNQEKQLENHKLESNQIFSEILKL